MLGNTYGLVRVSTNKQNEERQVVKMMEQGISKKNIIVEKESGKSKVRAKYHKLVKKLKAGDILYIENIDRLSRDYDGIISEWYRLASKNVIIKVLDIPILDTDQKSDSLIFRFIRNILLHILAFQAENEWIKIKERQAGGISVAKTDGKKLGRPKKMITRLERKTVKQYLSQEIDFDTALVILSIKKSAFYNLLKIIKNT